jgi:hypothetical protein
MSMNKPNVKCEGSNFAGHFIPLNCYARTFPENFRDAVQEVFD